MKNNPYCPTCQGRGWYEGAEGRYGGAAGIYGGNWSGPVLVITHRFDVARRADRVIMIEEARLVEQGLPTELASTASRYADHFQVQYAH